MCKTKDQTFFLSCMVLVRSTLLWWSHNHHLGMLCAPRRDAKQFLGVSKRKLPQINSFKYLSWISLSWISFHIGMFDLYSQTWQLLFSLLLILYVPRHLIFFPLIQRETVLELLTMPCTVVSIWNVHILLRISGHSKDRIHWEVFQWLRIWPQKSFGNPPPLPCPS